MGILYRNGISFSPSLIGEGAGGAALSEAEVMRPNYVEVMRR
jgi:hypothetical protein